MAIAITCGILIMLISVTVVLAAIRLSGDISREQEQYEIQQRLNELRDDSSTASS